MWNYRTRNRNHIQRGSVNTAQFGTDPMMYLAIKYFNNIPEEIQTLVYKKHK